MSTTGQHLADSERPWIGLASFTEADERFFAGRQQESAELLRLVRRDTLTLLYGVSGLGKTSLLQAGLFPPLRKENFLPVPIRLDHLDNSTPLTAQIHQAMATAAAAAGVECPGPSAGETLWEYFHRLGNHFWSPRLEPVTPVLVFDQFEELFTVGRENAGRVQRGEAFISEFADLVENRPPDALRDDAARVADFDFKPARLKVLLGMREDYLAELDRLRSRFRDLGQNRLRLLPMGARQATEVIELGSALIEPGIGERILAFVAGAKAATEEEITVAPALLSLVLRELNERRLARGAGSKITADLLDLEQAKILEGFYLRSLDGLPTGVRNFIEDALLTAGGFRNSCALDDALAREGVTQPTLDELVNRRLLAYEDRQRTRRVELTHDVLVPVIKASRNTRRAREERERTEAKEKEARELAEAKEREARAKLRRTRQVTGIVGVIGIAALIAFAWAVKERGEANAQRDAAGRSLDEAKVQRAAALKNFAEAEKQRTEARLNFDRADKKEKEQRETLQNASRADQITARKLRDAGRWSEAVAYLGRGIAFDPENTAIAQDLWMTLHYPPYRPAASDSPDDWGIERDGARQLLPVFAVASDQEVPSTEFNPNNARSVERIENAAVVKEVASGKVLASFPAPEWEHEKFSVDGRWLALAGQKGVRVWNAETGAPVGPMISVGKMPAPGAEVVLSRGGTRVAIWSPSAAQLWNAKDGKPIGRTFAEPDILAVGFVPVGNAERLRLVTNDARRIKVWDGETRTIVGKPLEHPDIVPIAAFDPGGASILTTCLDSSVHLWDAQTLERRGPLCGHYTSVQTAAFSPDGKRFTTIGSGDTVRVYENPGETMPIQELHADQVVAAGFSPDGKHIATLDFDGVTKLLENPSSPDPNAAAAKLVQMESWRFSREGALPSREPHARKSVTLAAEGGASDEARQQLTDRAMKMVSEQLKVPDGVTAIALNHDGSSLATKGPDGVTLWKIGGTAELGHPLDIHDAFSAAFSPDGSHIVVVNSEGTTVWKTVSGERVALETKHNEGAYFSPDSSRLLTLSATAPALWEVSTGRNLSGEMVHKDYVSWAAFSPDGALIVTASGDGTARLWHTSTGRPIGDPLAHPGPVICAEFSPDCTQILTVSGDGKIRLWPFRKVGSPKGDWIKKLVTAAGGYDLDRPDRLLIQDRVKLRQELMGVTPEEPEWRELLKWWLDIGSTRLIWPEKTPVPPGN